MGKEALDASGPAGTTEHTWTSLQLEQGRVRLGDKGMSRAAQGVSVHVHPSLSRAQFQSTFQIHPDALDNLFWKIYIEDTRATV